MTGDTEFSFHWADYLVFTATLTFSAGIGIYYAYKDRKQITLDDYLMAGRSMPILPVTVSLFVSWCSAISFLADPVEVYYHGAIYSILAIGYALGLIPAAHWFAPHFHRLNIVSCYEVRIHIAPVAPASASILFGSCC